MSPLRVLVADDNPPSLRFLTDALTKLGIDCTEADDGAGALEKASTAAFDLLMLDARMPKLGGPEVLAAVRAQNGPSQYAIALATTADDDGAVHAVLRAAGFIDVLVKPLGIDTLRRAMQRHFPDRAIGLPIQESLDDHQALQVAGGDMTIVTALRGLLVQELKGLPVEVSSINSRQDAAAMRERLHRLDASAGFCGARKLAQAAAALRAALDESIWPQDAIAQFLDSCSECARELGNLDY